MKRNLGLLVIGAALAASTALADPGKGPERPLRDPAQVKATHGCGCECKHEPARPQATTRSGDVSPEQRDREGWGGAG